MVFPVLNLIHCGIGRFCFCALASFTFVLNVLWDCKDLSASKTSVFDSCGTHRHLDCSLLMSSRMILLSSASDVATIIRVGFGFRCGAIEVLAKVARAFSRNRTRSLQCFQSRKLIQVLLRDLCETRWPLIVHELICIKYMWLTHYLEGDMSVYNST